MSGANCDISRRAKAGFARSRWLVGAGLAAMLSLTMMPPATTEAAPAGGKPQPVSATSASPPGATIARSQLGETYYARRYGVDQMRVRYTASGESLEFRYRVVDPDKAGLLNDKRAEPHLIDEQTGVRLEVPVMEKIGPLRQTASPEAGREYWMLFMNRGKSVKPGHRVDIEVGPFHVRGLTVE